ncbi:signal peptidase II [Sorangium sp. So ce119]|uniref:signal peptidase II n=1 Tax=Sorangium sp. So ce119 TaxID=3133279 RepID=UPI003F6063FA
MSSDGPHAPHGLQAPRASTAGHLPDELPPGERASLTFMAIVAVVSCAADLATKAWAHARLAGFDAKRSGAKVFTVIPDHLDFIFAQNPGGAWSFLRGLPDGLRRPFFLFVSAAAIVFIVSIYRRVHRDQTAMKWGLSLALGGAMGNLVDRIRYGWVIDFIDVYVSRGGQEFHWPTFNVADIAIVAGVILMSSDMIASARSAPAPDAGGGAARPAGGDAGPPLSTEAPPPAPPAS